MATATTTTTTAPKVRLVRCPKCLLVLPEVSDVPVYKCGGCDTILVAKNRKPIAKNTPVLQETEAAVVNESVRVLEHGESSGSSILQDVLPSRPESRISRESGEQSNGPYAYRDSDGDGGCAMLDENRSIDSRSNEGASDVDGASEGDMVDENRSNEGEHNGTGMLRTESLEHSNGSLANEFHHDQNEGLKLAAEANFEAECLSKSTTVRSSRAYDGSLSSFDGMDDHFPDQQLDSLHGYEGASPSHESRFKPLEQPREWPRLERDQYPSPIPLPPRAMKHPSSIPLPQRVSLHGKESAGPSRELQDRFKKAEYGDEENRKLLRMVYELQDQISKTCNLNENANARTRTDVPWKKSHFDAYNHQDEPSEDDSFDHPTYYGRHGLSMRTRFSRGEINSRHGIDNTCSCCHPQTLQHSDQLHPPMFPHNRGFCRGGTDHSCYNSYSSFPSSPQINLREKHHAARRHIRPTAGGAPFVTCYHCIRPLQLPADFLLFKRRFHELRCGGCSKVLKFSLRNRTQIVPYELVVEAPQPSKVEDRGDVINVRIPGFASPSDASTETYPSSYSDEYGHSFDISCSTDGNHLSAGPSRSKKASMELEGSPSRTRASPLHRLMGYSTLSQVLGRRRPSISDTSSNHSGKN